MGGGPEKKPEHLLCTLPFPEPKAILDRIRKSFPHLSITYRDLSHQDNFATDSGIPDELIHFFSAGTNHVQTTPIYKETTIALTTSSGIHGPQIAEWVLLTSLVSSHAYHTLHAWQTQHQWGKQSQNSRLRTIRDNVGQRLAVLGYGSIGRQVAHVAKAMGMDVIAFTASPRPTPESKHDRGFIVPGTGDPLGLLPSAWYSGLDTASLHHFLAQDIDWLVVSVPLTAATHHLLGAPEFDILARRHAFLSNISRGQILVQPDLIAALTAYVDSEPPLSEADVQAPAVAQQGAPRKGLRGAALDVTDPEPLPEGDPLWDAPNCIVTPHISGLSVMYADRAFQVLEANLKRREEGRGLINEVDRERGY
ncbi:hypothetical protein MMC11_000160 [Xylographa trunciseda]|nr:hypothetical protein [Xylographa trunciseda]